MRRPRCRLSQSSPDQKGQAAIESCLVLFLTACLACPCFEFGRICLDRMAASQAANALAALAASQERLDPEACLEASFPQISDAARVAVEISPAKKKSYLHRLSYGDGEFKDRASLLTFRKIEVSVEVSRDFATPIGALISPLLGTEGYRVEGHGIALKDETVQSGSW